MRKYWLVTNEGHVGRLLTYVGYCNCLKNLFIAVGDPSGVVNVPLIIYLRASVSPMYPRSVLKGGISVIFSVCQNLTFFSIAQTPSMPIFLYVGVQYFALEFVLYSTIVTTLNRLLPITALIIRCALRCFL